MISEYNEQTIDFYFIIILLIKCYKELSFFDDCWRRCGGGRVGKRQPQTEEDNSQDVGDSPWDVGSSPSMSAAAPGILIPARRHFPNSPLVLAG